MLLLSAIKLGKQVNQPTTLPSAIKLALPDRTQRPLPSVGMLVITRKALKHLLWDTAQAQQIKLDQLWLWVSKPDNQVKACTVLLWEPQLGNQHKANTLWQLVIKPLNLIKVQTQ
jgi:hypothetical protein